MLDGESDLFEYSNIEDADDEEGCAAHTCVLERRRWAAAVSL